MDLCAHYQALEGHTGLPDLGLSQKRELIPALKDSPGRPTILVMGEGALCVSEGHTLLRGLQFLTQKQCLRRM